jgi:tetratricopeptide (TPR) repeat protein
MKRSSEAARTDALGVARGDSGCDSASDLSSRPESRPAESTSDDVVSVTQLLHPPPKQAVQCLDRAEKLARAGRSAQATAELEKAIAIAPEYAEAHNNLGVQYLILNRGEEALQQFKAALEIAPRMASAYANLGWALLGLGRYSDAEQAARHGVAIDGVNPKTHMVLGCVLAKRDGDTAEAIQQLEIAARDLPAAATVLSRLRNLARERQTANGNLATTEQPKR